MRWIVLLVLSLFSLPLWAQAPAVTDDLINRADLIMRATVMKAETVDGGVNYQVKMALHENYKGSDDLATWPMFVSTAQQRTFNVRDVQVFFLKVDEAGHRTVLLDDPAAVQPGDRKASQALGDRIQAMNGITVTMDTPQPSYCTGEMVVLRCTITNSGNKPVSFYASKYAFMYDYVLDNMKYSNGDSAMNNRTEEDYKLLAPGDKFVQLVELRDISKPLIFPVGSLSVTLRYDDSGNWLGSKKKVTGHVANAPATFKETTYQVTITPPSAEKMVQLRKQLVSPKWHEQFDALYILSGIPEAAKFPEVRALAEHPWYRIRMWTAILLSREPGPLSPELRRLLSDPSSSVRGAASWQVTQQRIPNASLTLYALKVISDQLVGSGYVKLTSAGPANVEFMLRTTPDPRLGDVLAAQVKDGSDNGYLLNCILPREQQVKTIGTKIADGDKAVVLANWEKMRDKVKDRYTVEQFTTELASFRTRIMGDYTLDPQMDNVRELLSAAHNAANDQDAAAATLEKKYGPTIVPTILYIQRNAIGSEYDSDALYFTLMNWKAKEASTLCVSRALLSNRYAALAAFTIDPKLADAQLSDLMAENNGVAVALGYLGNTKAVPYIIEKLYLFGSRWRDEQLAALTKATGKSMNVEEWKKWWETAGKTEKW